MIQPDVLPQPQTPVFWIMVEGNQVIDTLDREGQFSPPLLPAEQVPEANERYTARIGEYEGIDVFLFVREENTPMLETWALKPLRECLLASTEGWFNLAARGCQIAGFLKTHKFCGQCGQEVSQDRDELAVVCGYCGLTSYPRISPVIIVGIYRGRDILLARGVRHPEGLFSVLAGFVESGETLEDTLHREVFEESGITVKNVEYISSQPWPFPHSLMTGFIAEYSGGELTLEPEELEEGGWFDIDDLPMTPPERTIAGRLIREIQSRIHARSD
ncbi:MULTISPECIES: NAD(+) diphosphatase [Gammaproteobacteria]|uniref:NAD(+) diphosphatase n=1 Tax=Gammaproteobacteria TaxID=1236 RepID=UPI000DD04C9A|nr:MULTISPECIES: NAD(+) diphosphatase [Gammaproteobacteria]RTE85708.1 NAD(+) diphosphatase [Aliidiomarina sp. B3213]TCZ90292.1 NAD(+) diphosphatase [Lysobacter sp. N42]